MTARFIVADVFDGLASLEPTSVDLVLTSPPFLALRSYLPADHADKHREIGSEPTPADYLDTLLDVVEACDRVLAPHGSLVFELGDTYSGSGGAGGDYNEGGLRDGQERFDGSKSRAYGTGSAPRPPRSNRPKYRDVDGGPLRNRALDTAEGIIPARSHTRSPVDGWPLDKSLTGIPTLFAWSLAYGRNLLRPERTTPAWRIRNVVAWCRPNPPVGALGDKFRPATSYLTVACKSGRRYFDLDATRGNPADVKDQRTRTTNGPKQDADPSEVLTANYHQRIPSNPAGAPPLDWWEIPTEPFKGSHYATWPRDLLVRPIKAMCPERVCRVCGEPSRRMVQEVDGETRAISAATENGERARINEDQANRGGRKQQPRDRAGIRPIARSVTTLGWTDCGCQWDGDNITPPSSRYRPGLVLDPFAGSGTTLAVATGHGRDAVGIDLDERNAELARQRVGMWLAVEHLEHA